MDPRLLKRLGDLEAFADLGAGRKGVRVSLQIQARLQEPSRDARRAQLRREFERIAQLLQSEGARVDLDSLSVSGQTVEAILPLDRVDEVEKRLAGENVRVDALIERKIV